MRRGSRNLVVGALVAVVVVIFLLAHFKGSSDDTESSNQHLFSRGGNSAKNTRKHGGSKGADSGRGGDDDDGEVARLLSRVDSLIADTKKKVERLSKLEGELEDMQLMVDAAVAAEAVPSQKQGQGDHNQKGNGGDGAQKNSLASHPVADADGVIAPVVVVACNRPSVSRALELLLKYRPSAKAFPIFVSQDCGDKKTADVIKTYANQGVIHLQQPDLSEPKVPSSLSQFVGYAKIARHFGWFLGQMFDQLNYDSVIIVEDDLEIAPDFYEYFAAGKQLLMQDETLWCVSAWNDNGKEGYVMDDAKLYRSDFFGGLGWMMTRKLWKEELGAKWPANFWDDWMREHEQRRGRACIRPEMPRTSTFGRVGVSRGLFFDQYLKYIKLADTHVSFTKKDLSYLLKDNYDLTFLTEVYADSPLVGLSEVQSGQHTDKKAVRLEYKSEADFSSIAKKLGIMDDIKDHIPRTAYYGVVSFVYKTVRVHLAPQRPWKGYEGELAI